MGTVKTFCVKLQLAESGSSADIGSDSGCCVRFNEWRQQMKGLHRNMRMYSFKSECCPQRRTIRTNAKYLELKKMLALVSSWDLCHIFRPGGWSPWLAWCPIMRSDQQHVWGPHSPRFPTVMTLSTDSVLKEWFTKNWNFTHLLLAMLTGALVTFC